MSDKCRVLITCFFLMVDLETAWTICTWTDTHGIKPDFDYGAVQIMGDETGRMIRAVHIQYFKYDSVHHLSCLGFTYGDKVTPCYGSSRAVVGDFSGWENITLDNDEYITHVEGETQADVYISRIGFKTNKGRMIGPFGPKTGFGVFANYNDGAPLLSVSGTAGLWLYEMEMSFSCLKVTDLKQISLGLARIVQDALRNNPKLLKILHESHSWMVLDLAKMGCTLYLSGKEQTGRESCTLQYFLQELSSLVSLSDTYFSHQPMSLLASASYQSDKLLEIARDTKNIKCALTQLRFDIKTSIEITNNQTQMIGNYLNSAATFARDIAEMDRVSLVSDLIKYKQITAELTEELNVKLTRILQVALAVTTADMVQKTAELATEIAQNSNPLKVLFATEMVKIVDRTNVLAAVGKKLTMAGMLLSNIKDYLSSLQKLADNFAKNEQLQTAMKKIVLQFDTATLQQQIALAEEFVAEYGSYDHQVSSREVLAVLKKLKAVAAKACGMVYGTKTAAGVAISLLDVASGDCASIQVLCLDLKEAFFSVYHYQFDIIDAMKEIVRSSIAQGMSKQMQVQGSQIDLTFAVVTSLMSEVAYQFAAHSRCNVLEYINGGKRPDVCKNLYFTDTHVTHIMAYKPMTSNVRNTYVYIPTSPQDGDSDYVNITDLIQHGKSQFQAQMNTSWLQKYRWFKYSRENVEESYYVKRLEMFIPGLKCKNGDDLEVMVKVTSDEYTQLFISEFSASYLVPSATYRFEYHGNADLCNDDNIWNFRIKDEDMRSRSSVPVCIMSRGELHNTPLLPSLLSTWNIQLLNENPACEIMYELDYTPLITVYMQIHELDATGIDECWPTGSRCKNATCVDQVLGFTCQ